MTIITVKTGGIAADAVTDAKIADDVVGTEHLTANEVDTAALKADAVTGAQLADNAVNSEHYTDGSIDTAHIADNQVTLAKLAGGTDGNIISFDASGDPVAIATGSDGQVLTSTGAGSPPAFEAIPGGGKVLQVLTATDVTTRSSTSTSFVTASNSLSVAITPSATSSKIFVQVSLEALTPSNARFFSTIYRDSTNLGDTNGMASINQSVDGASVSMTFLDSPSSTSELTYAVYIKTNGTQCQVNANNTKSCIVVMEIGA